VPPTYVFTVSIAASALIASVWVAICAAAPEFIWQGLWIAHNHITRADILSALLVGMVLAFFVEPLMERLRGMRGRHAGTREPGSALYTAALSLVFALASIGLHDAMVAFVSAHEAAAHGGLADAIALTTAWAIVPFAVTLAWFAAPVWWLAVPLGIVGALSPCFAGWLFAWPLRSVVTTAVPSLAILALGYRQTVHAPSRTSFAPRAFTVAWVAAAWLAAALLFDLVVALFGADKFRLYNTFAFWVDVRFYLGWSLGLLLAPSPYRSRAARLSD
jgi:hypothetical protein